MSALGAGLDSRPHGARDLSLLQLFAVLWDRRWIFVAISSAFIVLFAVVAFTSDRYWAATAVLVPAEIPGSGSGAMRGLGGLAATIGLSLDDTGDLKVQEALAVMRSREFVGQFVDEQGIAPALFPEAWDAAKKDWRPGKAPTRMEVVRRFLDLTRIARDRITFLYSVRIEWPDAAIAARLANAFVAKINAEMRARALAQSAAAIEQLELEMSRSRAMETRLAISRLLESQINQRAFANTTQEYAFRVVDRAVAAEMRDNVRPNKPLLLVLGALVGGFVAIVSIFVAYGLKHSRAPSSAIEQTTRLPD
jgi:uncharacterized protein involved in exopolysaccharide biosynthesis